MNSYLVMGITVRNNNLLPLTRNFKVGFLIEFSAICFLLTYPLSVKLSNFSILMLCSAGLASSSISDKIKSIKSAKWIWFFLLYYFILALGLFYSKDVYTGWKLLEKSIPFVILPICLGTTTIQKQTERRIKLYLVASAFFTASFCLAVSIKKFITENIPWQHFFDWKYTYENLSSIISFHPTYFSILVVISIIIVLHEPSLSLYLKITLGLYLSFFTVILGSKIGIVLLVIVINIIAIQFLKRSKLQYILIYLLANAVLITILFNTSVVYWRFRRAIENTVISIQTHKASDYRILHWECAQSIIRSHPIFGVGTGDASKEMNLCYARLQQPALSDYNAHNQYLESWTKAGILGILITFVCLYIPFIKSYQNRNFDYTLMFLIFLSVSLVESILCVQKGIALFCFLSMLYLVRKV